MQGRPSDELGRKGVVRNIKTGIHKRVYTGGAHLWGRNNHRNMDCLQCHSAIMAGRADRKFCSDACKHEYHNAEKMRENGETRAIILALKQNRRILKWLLGARTEMYVPKESLAKNGFDFDYHTHRQVSAQGNTFFLCFDFGYRVMEEGRLKLVKWNRSN